MAVEPRASRLPAAWSRASRAAQRAAFAVGLVAFAGSLATGLVHALLSSGSLPGILLPPHRQGDASLGQRDYARAEAEFGAAFAIDPSDTYSLHRLAETFDRAGDGATAFAAYEDWLGAEAVVGRAQPRDLALAHNRMGELAEGQGRLIQAVEHFENALALHPDLPAALAGLERVRGRPTEEEQAP